MTQEHPITPPPELMRQWLGMPRSLALEAAYRAGADQELEACCEYLTRCAAWEPEDVQEMRDLRRPKPPSLKEQALEALKHAEEGWRPIPEDCALIRRALESLPS